MLNLDSMTIAKLVGVTALYLFLPFTALTYYVFRRHRRTVEIERLMAFLNLEPSYRQAYHNGKSGAYFLCAVAYASVVAYVGLSVLFLGTELGLDNFPTVQLGTVQFPQAGSRVVFGMAFLGAYLWGLQHVFRRYALNDLIPSVYFDLGMRMLLAAIIALVLFSAYEALSGGDNADGGIAANLWPAMAFLIGMFPQRGVRWLTERLPFFAAETDPAVRQAPLEMIEGVELHDVIRLEELGIDTCYDLATADFVPLMLKTPYSARQLVDWILQAKLCVYFGPAVRDLRQRGIRTIGDLEHLTTENIEALTAETTATKLALERACAAAKNDPELRRLRELGQALGRFWEKKQDDPEPSSHAIGTTPP